MEKLSNYIKDYDNVVSVVNDDEYKYCNIKPLTEPQLLCKTKDSNKKFLVRIKTDNPEIPNYIELASNLNIKQIITTESVTGFVTSSGEFFMIYDGIQYFEKITNHIQYAIAGENIFCLITEKNIPIFVSTCNGQVIDDDFWLNKSIKTIYNIKNKFFIITECNCLYIFDGCVKMGFIFDEIKHQVKDIVLTLDTVTVLTIYGKVWVFGDKEHGAYITNGRGFIPGINSAKQVVRTIRAGAILTDDNSVWAWGSVLYGGSPRPGWVQGLKDNCKRLLSTSTSIIAITHANQLWAWSNEWFKTYSLPESDFAVAGCINSEFNNFKFIKGNKTSWLVQTRNGQYHTIGKNMKLITIPNADIDITKLDYGWLFISNKTGLLYTDMGIKKIPNIFHISHFENKLLIQSLRKVDMISIHHNGQVRNTINHIPGNIFTSYISDKHGFMYITDDCNVYHNVNQVYKNKDCQFSIGIINYKEIILYIQYHVEEKKTVKIQEKPIEIICPPCPPCDKVTIINQGTPKQSLSTTVAPPPSPPKQSLSTTLAPPPSPPKQSLSTTIAPPSPPKQSLSTTIAPPKQSPLMTTTAATPTLNPVLPLIQIQPMPSDLGVGKYGISTIMEKFSEATKNIFSLNFIKRNIEISMLSFVLFIIFLFLIFTMIIKIFKK